MSAARGSTMLHNESTSPKLPLHKFPICDSDEVDSWSEATLPVFGPTRTEPKRDSKTFQALINFCPLQSTTLCYGRFGGAFNVSVDESVSFVQGMPIRGEGEHVNNGMNIPYSPRKGAVGGPGTLALSYGPDLEILAVFMKPGALHAALSGLIGAPLGKKLELDRSNYDSRPEPRVVRSLVQLLIAELDHDEGDLSPLVLAELEQAILVAFLSGTGHNYARLLEGRPRRVAPSQVRIVEEYIEAHWNQPVSIEALEPRGKPERGSSTESCSSQVIALSESAGRKERTTAWQPRSKAASSAAWRVHFGSCRIAARVIDGTASFQARTVATDGP